MPNRQSIGWAFKASSNTGSAIQATNEIEADTVTKVSLSVGANETDAEFLLQLSRINKIKFFSVFCSVLDGTVSIKPDHADGKTVKLEGPLILFGESVNLIGPTLNKLLVTNAGAADIDITILIGRAL